MRSYEPLPSPSLCSWSAKTCSIPSVSKGTFNAATSAWSAPRGRKPSLKLTSYQTWLEDYGMFHANRSPIKDTWLFATGLWYNARNADTLRIRSLPWTLASLRDQSRPNAAVWVEVDAQAARMKHWLGALEGLTAPLPLCTILGLLLMITDTAFGSFEDIRP